MLRIRDPVLFRPLDPDLGSCMGKKSESGIKISYYVSESWVTLLLVKYTQLLCYGFRRDGKFRIRNPGFCSLSVSCALEMLKYSQLYGRNEIVMRDTNVNKTLEISWQKIPEIQRLRVSSLPFLTATATPNAQTSLVAFGTWTFRELCRSWFAGQWLTGIVLPSCWFVSRAPSA